MQVQNLKAIQYLKEFFADEIKPPLSSESLDILAPTPLINKIVAN